MDDIVKQALAKWPNVPDCYGWLALDARGAWRMRDERAQALALPGERITHPALVGFINRNYASDERGCWYFQNGPQRVYVTLEATPYIVRTDPVQGWLLHTGEPILTIDSVWMTQTGQLILVSERRVALLDDRDLAQVVTHVRMAGHAIDDAQLLTWLQNNGNVPGLTLALAHGQVPVQFLASSVMASRLGFVSVPS